MHECEVDRPQAAPEDVTTAEPEPEPELEPELELQRLREQVQADRVTIHNLEQALGTARTIGTAMGIVMAGRRCSPDDAFRYLAGRSQQENLKVRALAEQIVLTGEY